MGALQEAVHVGGHGLEMAVYGWSMAERQPHEGPTRTARLLERAKTPFQAVGSYFKELWWISQSIECPECGTRTATEEWDTEMVTLKPRWAHYDYTENGQRFALTAAMP